MKKRSAMVPDPIASQPEAAALVSLSDRLTTALRAVIDSSSLRGLGPIEIARTLGVDKTLASRLMGALRAGDPLRALSVLPGTVPLRGFVRAARRHGADAAAVRAAEAELGAFERELQRSFGTRTRLDAVITEVLPAARRRHQESARQAVYRGLSLIKGVSIDLASVTWLIYPSRDRPDLVDIQVLAGFTGVRRLRPTARVRLGSGHVRTTPGGATLVGEFCRPADLSIRAAREGQLAFYEIATGPIRRDAVADVFLAETLTGVGPRTGAPDPGRVYLFGDAVAHPYKRLVLNVLVHREAWPGCDFSVRAYDTVIRGMVQLPDPAREIDQLPLDAAVTRGAVTLEAVRSSPIPRYAELLDHVAGPLGLDWAGGAFRMFGCEVVYPLYASEIMLVRE